MIISKSVVAAGVLAASLASAPMTLGDGAGANGSELRLEGPNGPISFVVDDVAAVRGRLEEGYVLLNDINCGLAPETRDEATGECSPTINLKPDFEPVGWTAWLDGVRYEVDIHAVDGGPDDDSSAYWSVLLPVFMNGQESGFFLDLNEDNSDAVMAALARYAERDSISLDEFLRVLEMDKDGNAAGLPHVEIDPVDWPTSVTEVMVCGQTFKVRFGEGSGEVVPGPDSEGKSDADAKPDDAARPDSDTTPAAEPTAEPAADSEGASDSEAEPHPAPSADPDATADKGGAAAPEADKTAAPQADSASSAVPERKADSAPAAKPEAASGAKAQAEAPAEVKAPVAAEQQAAPDAAAAAEPGAAGQEAETAVSGSSEAAAADVEPQAPQTSGAITEAKSAPKLPVTGMAKETKAASKPAASALSHDAEAWSAGLRDLSQEYATGGKGVGLGLGAGVGMSALVAAVGFFLKRRV